MLVPGVCCRFPGFVRHLFFHVVGLLSLTGCGADARAGFPRGDDPVSGVVVLTSGSDQFVWSLRCGGSARQQGELCVLWLEGPVALNKKKPLQMSLSPLRNIALTSTWQLSLSPLLIHTTPTYVLAQMC